jgi:tetratricopeptide (TPR) repeat protein
VDVQGPEVVRPYTEKFAVTFPVAVDRADLFGRAFGLRAIPVSFLVDEVGIIRLRGAGPKREFLAEIEQLLAEPVSQVRGTIPDTPAALPRHELEKRVIHDTKDWQARLALAHVYDEAGEIASALQELEAAATIRPEESAIHFLWGQILLRQDEKEAALAKLRQARDLDPENWRIRKQIWAIENPDKFYTGDSPDFGWQREELAREKRPAR